jgi:hypothetical protein
MLAPMPALSAVPFTRAHLTRGFWAERLATNRTSTIPTALAKCDESGRFYNFERAAAALRGEPSADVRPPAIPSTTPTCTRSRKAPPMRSR